MTTLFLKSLLQSASDFLGKPIEGCVLTVPASFTSPQREALQKAAEDAGVVVLQLLDEVAAVAAATATSINGGVPDDRTQLVVDVGSSSLSLALLSIRQGLTHVLGSSLSTSSGGDLIDSALLSHFAADFTKKTKIPLSSTDPADARAQIKLLLSLEHTKRTLSASPGAATCSVESLKDGYDYTGTINRMRFDMLASPVYNSVSSAVHSLLADAGIDSIQVDEIVYVGGTTCLPGLDSHLCLVGGFAEDIVTSFSSGTVVGGGVGDPTTIIARGCAVQAALIYSLSDDEREKFSPASKVEKVAVAGATVGVLFPSNEEQAGDMGGVWVPVVLKDTVLPARRTVSLDVGLPPVSESQKFGFEVWMVKEGIRVEKVKPPKVQLSDDEGEEEEEDEEEVKTKTVTKHLLLGGVLANAKCGLEIKGKGPDAGKWNTSVQIQFVVGPDASLEVEVREVGGEGVVGRLSVSA